MLENPEKAGMHIRTCVVVLQGFDSGISHFKIISFMNFVHHLVF